MIQRTFGFALCLLLASVAFAQTKTPVEGVWKIVEEVRTGPNPFRISNPQPSLVIFTKGGHYSWVNVPLASNDLGAYRFARPLKRGDRHFQYVYAI